MSFNQGAPTVPTLINSSAVLVTGNAVSANALTVRQFGTGNVFSAQTTTGATALFVGANGNVGIGTASLGATLTVLSNLVHFSNTLGIGYQNGGGIALGSCNGGPGLGHWYIGTQAVNRDNGAGPFFDYGNQGDLIFNRHSGGLASAPMAEVMRISGTSGNVGIGTTNPIWTLSTQYAGSNDSTSTANLNFAVEIHNSVATGANNRHNLILFTDNNSTQAAMGGFRRTQTADYTGGLVFYVANQPAGYTQSRPASTLQASTSLTEAMRIDYNGRVGIGTASPAFPLDVSCGAAGTADNITWRNTTCELGRLGYTGATSGGGGFLSLSNSGSLGGGVILRGQNGPSYINSGNVGIGTTNPNAKLDVRGSSNILGVTNSGPSLFVNGNPNEFGLDSLIKITTSGGSQNNSAPYVNRAFLELQSNTAQGNFNYNMISVTRNAGTPGEAKYAHITGDGSAYFAGNVGIGTNAPAYKLEVIGIGNMIAATNLQSTVTQMLGTSTTIGFTGTKTNHNTYIVSNNGAGGNIVLNAAGTAFFPLSGSTCELGGASNRWSTIYAVNALNTSDRNLKENISDAPLGIDFVNALNPKTFTWKEYTQTVVNPVTDEPRTVTKPAGTRLQYGLIAQDVKDVLDKFGIDSKDFAGYVDSTVNEPDKPQVLYLNYIQFIPILIKSVKELSAENTTLKQSLASMESRLAALEARG